MTEQEINRITLEAKLREIRDHAEQALNCLQHPSIIHNQLTLECIVDCILWDANDAAKDARRDLGMIYSMADAERMAEQGNSQLREAK